MAKGTFGERLKRERDLREVSAEELCKATRISPRFLDALENEDWNKLPGGVFGRGFVRTIARYLGLSEESLLAEYDAARGKREESAAHRPEDRIPRPPNWVPALAVIAALLVLVGAYFAGRYAWHLYMSRRAHKTGIASAATPTSAAVSEQPDSLELMLATSAPTHVRVLGDGNTLLDENLTSGAIRHFSARDRFEVTAANASVVLLELNGQPMPPPADPDSSGTIVLSHEDLRQAPVGNSQP
jgi:cytoskeleton protein RodZ